MSYIKIWTPHESKRQNSSFKWSIVVLFAGASRAIQYVKRYSETSKAATWYCARFMSCFAWYQAPKAITRSMKRWKIRFWCFCRHLRWTNMYGPPEWCNRSTKRCALWKRNQKRQHTTFHRLEVFPAASVQTVLNSLQPCWAFWPDSKMKAGRVSFSQKFQFYCCRGCRVPVSD